MANTNPLAMNETSPTSINNYAAPSRGPIEAVKICLIKYADFSGRASRSEFWWFLLLVRGIYWAIIIASGVLWKSPGDYYWTIYIFGLLWHYAWILPIYAASVRRVRDAGQSGWWVLLAAPAEMLNMIPTLNMIPMLEMNPRYLAETMIDSPVGVLATCISIPPLIMLCLRSKTTAI